MKSSSGPLYADVDILYAQRKPSDWLQPVANHALQQKDIITSIVAITELELVSTRDFSEAFANDTLDWLKKHTNIQLVAFTEAIQLRATALRKEYGIGIFDAIHVATAQEHNAIIITTDHIIHRIPCESMDPRDIK